MGPLNHDEILKVHAAVVSAQLVGSRDALLVGIDGRLVAGLPSAATPSDQILRDLDTLNSASVLADGSMPLATWLANAVAQAGPRKEGAIFRAALDRYKGPTALQLATTAGSLDDVARPFRHRRPLMIALGGVLMTMTIVVAIFLALGLYSIYPQAGDYECRILDEKTTMCRVEPEGAGYRLYFEPRAATCQIRFDGPFVCERGRCSVQLRRTAIRCGNKTLEADAGRLDLARAENGMWRGTWNDSESVPFTLVRR